MNKMDKESTATIYNCLNSSFWTSQKCRSCHQFFTLPDYQAQNYQLTFLEVLKTVNSNLEVAVQLSHKSCCSDCTSYLQEVYQTKKC